MTRRNKLAGVEYRTVIPTGEAAAVDETGKLNGVAVRFNSATQIGEPSWGFREQFAPGAFTKTLSESDVVLLDNHDTARPIARKSAGTLSLRQGDALHWDADPTSNASYINDVRENVRSGNYGGCSFGFQAVKEDWLDDAGNPSDSQRGTQRIVREAKLFEVSVCTFPAYGDTSVSTRDAVSAAREARAKYTAEEVNDLGAKGQAFKNADGHYSYPIANADDLDNAIKAVGRGGADHDAIRKYTIGRAKALGLSSKIPDSWGSDGSLSEQKSAAALGDQRAAKATYADLDTCGECGATSQYGKFCTDCGKPMTEPKPAGNYCQSCGSKMTGNRADHVCAEQRHATAATDASHAADKKDILAPMDAALDEAMKYFNGADRDSLPAEINQAIDLVAGVVKQVGSAMQADGEPDPDKPNGNTYDGGRSAATPKPEDSTSGIDMRKIRFRLESTRKV